MLALHLLQSALVHVNTLLMRQVLADPQWADKLTEADRRALSPLFWTHVNPYGSFELDMNSRLDLDLSVQAAVPGPRSGRMRNRWRRPDGSLQGGCRQSLARTFRYFGMGGEGLHGDSSKTLSLFSPATASSLSPSASLFSRPPRP